MNELIITVLPGAPDAVFPDIILLLKRSLHYQWQKKRDLCFRWTDAHLKLSPCHVCNGYSYYGVLAHLDAEKLQDIQLPKPINSVLEVFNQIWLATCTDKSQEQVQGRFQSSDRVTFDLDQLLHMDFPRAGNFHELFLLFLALHIFLI